MAGAKIEDLPLLAAHGGYLAYEVAFDEAHLGRIGHDQREHTLRVACLRRPLAHHLVVDDGDLAS